MRRYLSALRRRWCAWRGHPDSRTGPVSISHREPDRFIGGEIEPGAATISQAYRCLHHDPAPLSWEGDR